MLEIYVIALSQMGVIYVPAQVRQSILRNTKVSLTLTEYSIKMYSQNSTTQTSTRSYRE